MNNHLSYYDLMSLPELKSFIESNHHLPGVPSALEVGETGQINMTEMQRTLLEKVEELTLYTLAQEETIASLIERIEMMEAQRVSEISE